MSGVSPRALLLTSSKSSTGFGCMERSKVNERFLVFTFRTHCVLLSEPANLQHGRVFNGTKIKTKHQDPHTGCCCVLVVLYCTTLYCMALYDTAARHCTTLYCTTLYCTVHGQYTGNRPRPNFVYTGSCRHWRKPPLSPERHPHRLTSEQVRGQADGQNLGQIGRVQ